MESPESLSEVAAQIQACRRCDLWRMATQGVAGEGRASAALMLIGEQPGDAEDRAGHPFVGPAGKVLERAIAEAGVDREEIWLTNAVKHFKHEVRGKRRLHKRPDSGEIRACRWWLEAERRLVRPRVILALGASAAQSVFGRSVPVAKSRRRPFDMEDGSIALVTFHPSRLLRLRGRDERHAAFAELVDDLSLAASLAVGSARRRRASPARVAMEKRA
ncbi:MAG: UdgX family uracil-DNA binding protein [Caulobacteraceae bacterium]